MTSDEQRLITDPLIDEVRARRRELMDSCNNDLNKLLELIQNLQKKHPEHLVDHRTIAVSETKDRST